MSWADASNEEKVRRSTPTTFWNGIGCGVQCWYRGHGGQISYRHLNTERRRALKLIKATMSLRQTPCGMREIERITAYKPPRNL